MSQPGEARRRVLLISHDIVGAAMAGPGIRYYHLARTLAPHVDVTLAVPHGLPQWAGTQPFAVGCYQYGDWSTIASLVAANEILIFPSDIASEFPQIGESQAVCVVDGYDPLLAEWLALAHAWDLVKEEAPWWHRVRNLNRQYLVGDFFICASERQRDWWLGLLEAAGRLNPWTYEEDSTLRSLVDVVPFGLPEAPPRRTRAVVKGVWPGIAESDCLVLWGGGLWPWLDPLTAIRAIAKVRTVRDDVKLVFPGTRHPNPIMKVMPTLTEAARREAETLNLLDSAVFFGEWVPYDDWPNVLLESDVALSLHFDGIETRLAFRSRMFDYIWAGLPVVATGGDATSEIVARHGIGVVVGYEDADAVAVALLELLATPRQQHSAGFEAARAVLTWERAAQPLIDFCLRPRRAPDRVRLGPRLGNPYYLEEQAALLQERDRLAAESEQWRALAAHCEQERAQNLSDRQAERESLLQ
ncbi:MAG TPA: glycosyltransferase, partial [Ardenticatenaceae bacterium]|nr:glycosyltransferase [Ardenticatenaceae bacterium]